MDGVESVLFWARGQCQRHEDEPQTESPELQPEQEHLWPSKFPAHVSTIVPLTHFLAASVVVFSPPYSSLVLCGSACCAAL